MTDLYDIAVDLADQAIPTFPCSASKSPLISKDDGGKGFADATFDHDPAVWQRAALIGMPTGDMSGFDIVDIDPRHGGDIWLADNITRLPVTRTVRTMSGGYHIYFNARPGMRCSVSRIAGGVDVRAEGGYVIRWDAAGYGVENPDTIADWPEWLADVAQTSRVRHRENANRTAADVEAPSVAAVVELLDAMPNPDDTSRDVYLQVMLAARGCGEDPDIAEAAVRWADRWSGSPGADVEAEKWDKDFALRDAPLAGWSNLLAAATRFGVDVTKYRALTPSEFDAVSPVCLRGSDSAEQRVEIMGNPHWHSKILTTDKGAPRASIANALLAMRESPAWAGILGYDEFSARDMFVTPPPWHRGVFVPRELEDTDHTYAAEWLHVEGISVSTACAAEAMHGVAKESPYHPVRTYLHGLRWDGTPRLDTWLVDHLGAANTPLNRAFGSKFLISAVARVMHPGCQVDTMLVLEGDQGIRKSTALRILAGEGWFTDHIPDLHNKDAQAQIQGIWLMEHAELATLGKADANRAKEFISRRVDRFRPSFGRVAIDFPRQCVFAASVNPGGLGYLKDETGARRFWPVLCGVGWSEFRQVDTAKLIAARDQLWAEAVECMAAGVPWWLDAHDLQHEQREETDQRFDADVWTDIVRDIVDQLDTVRSIDVLGHSRLNLPAKDMDPVAQRRVGSILAALGWKRYKRYIADLGKSYWVFERPASWPALSVAPAPDDMDALAS